MAAVKHTQSEVKAQYPWWVYLIEGVIAIALGTLLLIVPEVTIQVLVQFLGIYLLIKGILAIVSIFTHPAKWGLKLILGLLGIAAGYLILDHPFNSALAVSILWVYLIAILAISMGLLTLIQAVTGAGWAAAILGIVAIFLGILVMWQPVVTFLALPYILGLLFVGGGISAILGSLAMFYKRGAEKELSEETVDRAKSPDMDVQEGQVESEVGVSGDGSQETADVDQDETPIILLEETTLSSQEGEESDTRPTLVPEEVSWAYEGEGDESGAGAGAVVVGAAVIAAATDEEEEVSDEGTSPDGELAARGVVLEQEYESGADLGQVDEELDLDVGGEPDFEDLEESPGEIDAEVVEVMHEEEDTLSTAGGDEEIVVTAAVMGVAEVDEPDPSLEDVETLGSTVEPDRLDVGDAEQRLLNHRVQQMEGIGPVYSEKLGEIGINTAMDLLSQGAIRKGRVEIADKTGISQKLVLKWVNQADLYRVSGIGSEYAELLEASGVDTVVELATRKPDNLHQAMVTTNEEKKLVRQVPALAQVERWVQQAKELPRIIRY